MNNTSTRSAIKAQLETRDHYAQAAAEGAALRGELGSERQIRALAARYAELRAAGEINAARVLKYQAIVIRAANSV